MKYYVELQKSICDITVGRLYPIDDGMILDDVGDPRAASLWEDKTGYTVEIDK